MWLFTCFLLSVRLCFVVKASQLSISETMKPQWAQPNVYPLLPLVIKMSKRVKSVECS